MYRAIIVDDEPTARDILETHLSKIETIEVVASCKNAMEGFSILASQKIDLIFLDINMPEVSGLMFAKAVKGKAAIIFTTAYREHAIDGFELQAMDYLLKPISMERLMQAVHKFVEHQGVSSAPTNYDFTFFRIDRKMVKVDFNSISYIESCGDYIKIHQSGEVLISRETVSGAVEKLPSTGFIRTHRSFIVSVAKIENYTTEHITLDNKSIPIGRSYREEVGSHLNNL